MQRLDNTWQFALSRDSLPTLLEKAPRQLDFDNTPVPGTIDLKGASAAILRRQFTLDAPLKEAHESGARIVLTFGGFAGPLYAWVDGSHVGYCTDGFIPTAFDVTEALTPTQTHDVRILLLASKACSHGLFREVSLEARFPHHFLDLITTASYEAGGGRLRVFPHVQGAGRVRLALLDPDQLPLWEVEANPNEEYVSSPLEVAPWSAEDPTLYTLVAQLEGDRIFDTVAVKVGFRSLYSTPGGLILNGSPLTLRGVVRDECHPRTGLAVGLAEMVDDIVWCKRHGVNAIALAHAPSHARFYELADEYGLYIIDRPSSAPTLEGGVENAQVMVARDRTHPSVIAWSLPEADAQGGENLRPAVASYMVEADGTRPIVDGDSFPHLAHVRSQELHYSPVRVTPTYSGVRVRNNMAFTSTADLDFLCRLIHGGQTVWESSISLDVAPGEEEFLPIDWPDLFDTEAPIGDENLPVVREVSAHLSYGTGWAPAGFEIARGTLASRGRD